jgi:hypothetical protein
MSNKDIIKVKWTGRADPLRTMMYEESVKVGGRIEVKLPASDVVWLEAPESVTQSVTTGGVKAMVLKELLLIPRAYPWRPSRSRSLLLVRWRNR